jgi:hypothetical protein
LLAKEEKKQLEMYGMDLVWLLAKRYYGNLPMPSEIGSKKYKVDKRTAKEIIRDTIKGIGGE